MTPLIKNSWLVKIKAKASEDYNPKQTDSLLIGSLCPLGVMLHLLSTQYKVCN